MSEEIERFIRLHSGFVLVQIVEPFLDIGDSVELLLEEIGEVLADVHVMRVELSLHREWARKYRVYGSPCTLIFRDGKLALRLPGRVGRTRLRQALRRAGLIANR